MTSAILAAALQLSARFDALLDSGPLKGATASVVLSDAAGKVLYARNPDIRVAPASNEKILTCAFAMAVLGPDAVLKTRIWKTDDGLLVDAPGDPSITSAQLKEIGGRLGGGPRLVKVREAFRVNPPPTWEWDDLPYRYAAPVTAFTVDRGSWELYAKDGTIEVPDAAVGVKTARRRVTGEIDARFSPWTRMVDVDGALPQERKRIAVFALPEPDRTAAGFLGGRLMAYQGSLPDFPPFAALTSAPVKRLIKDCLEPSDNLYAEHLLMTAASSMGPLGSDPYTEAASRLKRFYIEKVGLASGDLRPIDGSGLSRQNLVTASAIVKILRWADSQPWAADFREALAAPGEGTLASRLKSVPFVGKTGTINAVSSLSGIIHPGGGDRLYISILFNGALASGRELRAIQDDLVTAASAESRHAQP